MKTYASLRDKLAESGLNLQDAKRFGLRQLTDKATAKLAPHFREAPSIHLPYYDPITGKSTGFFRIRYLKPLSSFALGRKYDNPPNTPPHAYFPRGLPWSKIFADHRTRIVIVEGELKSLAAAKHKIPCIGLGGVWSFKSRKQGFDFLPELDAGIQWEKRKVELCFDSDIVAKPEVRAALLALSRELVHRKAQVSTVYLPAKDDEKVGLDDFIVAEGVEAWEDLERKPPDFEEEQRHALLRRFVYIDMEDHVYDTETKHFYRNKQHFMNATSHLTLRVPDPKGGVKIKPIHQEFYASPHVLRLGGYVFRPDLHDRLLPEHGFNLYEGLRVEPRRGSVAPMLQIIDKMIDKRRRPEIRDWFLQWLAYPLVNAGRKLETCVYLYSHKQGIGKSAVGKVMNDIYGAHGKELSEEDVFSQWNEWLEFSLFALCDELSFDGSKKSRAVWKRLITGEQVRLSAKYRERRDITNRCNFYFTGNSPGGLPLDPVENRRVLIIEAQDWVSEEYMRTTFNDWRWKQDGPSHWLYYLLHDVDLTGFDPNAEPPKTEEMQKAIASSTSSLEVWLRENLNSHKILMLRDIWPARRVLELYRLEADDQRTKITAMNRALDSLGCHKMKSLVLDGTFEQSLWALRNFSIWRRAGLDAIRKEWNRNVTN